MTSYQSALKYESAGGQASALRDALDNAVSFQDLLVASSLRKRALGENVDTTGGFSLAQLVQRNPWFKEHRVQMSSLIEERARNIVAAEQEHLARLAKARRLPAVKNVALARIDMMLRHATSEITNVSEQVAMGVPEVGASFPFGEYLTRDDRRVRPTHKAMYGFIAQRKHIIWETIRPPCGFNCRCFVRWLAWPESIKRGFATKDREPRIDIRWPNTASRRNFEQLVFPDEGWRGPKIVAA